MEGNFGRESLDFGGRQEGAGGKGLGDGWHGGSGGGETTRAAPGRERQDGGEAADPAAPSPSPQDKA